MNICSKLTGFDWKEGMCILHTDTADILLCLVTDKILRIRTSFDRDFQEESYCLMTTAWEDRLDFLFSKERNRREPAPASIEDTNEVLYFTGNALQLVVRKDPLQLLLYEASDPAHHLPLYATLPGAPFTRTKNGRITAYSCMQEDDCFYGFGEKAGLLNKNKTMVRERATDAMGYDACTADTLYKHIPFYISLNRSTHKAAGIFYHNFSESVFNMGCEKSNYLPRYSYWQAESGELDLFLMGGPTFSEILNQYTTLTGRPVLLPKRALGYQGSSMYYAELEKDSDKAVLDFIDTAATERLPLDGFHLSSGYTCQDGKRCVFTWNKERFPKEQSFFREMQHKQAPVVANVKPGVLLCHPKRTEWENKGIFIKSSVDSKQSAVGPWWGGNGVFWDFTSPQGRAEWKTQLTEQLLRYGCHSIWNDNCEYDSLLDTDSLCDFDGKGGTIGQLKPLMSTLMCKTSAEAVTGYNPNLRPYVVCRSGSAGIQRYAQTWAGDNYTDWKTLKYNIPTITGMGLSGQPNEGADIGGFAGPAPEMELFVRWIQQGIFQPRFSIHSANCDNTVTEPWMYSEATTLIRSALRLRYRMTPYLYSAEYLASISGAPIMRALVYDFQEDPGVYEESFTYLFGDALLVANVLEPGAVTRSVYLPAGCRWYDWNDNYHCYEGGQIITVPVLLDTIPMFLRDGAVLFMADNPIMNMEHDRVTALHLVLSTAKPFSALLYDDDGVSNDYLQGIFRKTTIVSERTVDRFSIHLSSEGAYPDYAEKITIEAISAERAPVEVFLQHQITWLLPVFHNRTQFEAASEGWYYSLTKRTVIIKYSNPCQDYSIIISDISHDFIGM